MPKYNKTNSHKRPQPKILNMEDAKKLAEYDGLVEKLNLIKSHADKLQDANNAIEYSSGLDELFSLINRTDNH